MGFRRKIKTRLKSILRTGDTPSPVSVSPVDVASEPTAQVTPTQPESQSIPPTKESSTQPTQTPVTKVETQDESVVDKDEAKIAKHMLRTKKGVLKFVLKQGGTSSLADMHNHSETRFFVGHKKFSDLMELMVAEDLIEYSWEEQQATLTTKGEEFLSL